MLKFVMAGCVTDMSVERQTLSPSRSTAHTRNDAFPLALGFPVSTPFSARFSPVGGKPDPDASWKWYGGCPPLGLLPLHDAPLLVGAGEQNEYEYVSPTLPDGIGEDAAKINGSEGGVGAVTPAQAAAMAANNNPIIVRFTSLSL